MARHTTSGNWRLGLSLALLTVIFWSTLPIALKLALSILDAYTLTWFRFLIAAVLLFAWLLPRGKLREFTGVGKPVIVLLLLAAVMLTGNYLLHVLSLDLISPGNAQIIIQLAPLLMALGGLVFFRENYQPLQWCGFAILVAGLALFFSDQIQQIGTDRNQYIWGTLLMILASLAWAGYALLQKQLLQHLSSQGVLMFIYIFAALAILPGADPASVLPLNNLQWLIVVYCALNTLGAYGAFAEALNHWEMSRIGAVLSLTPMGTLLTVYIVHRYWPNMLAPEQMNMAGWTGALLVVAGSMITSLGGRRNSP